MVALRSQFDGQGIITPNELRSQKPCDVIIVLLEREDPADRAGWQALQGDALQNAWDNDEDAVYDKL
jgi:hypothetical protein